MVDTFIQYFTSAIQLMWTDGDLDVLEAVSSHIPINNKGGETFQRVIVMFMFLSNGEQFFFAVGL